MNIATPRIPIRLPTNSIVSLISVCVGARKTASIAPTTIIGIPIPTEICLEAIKVVAMKIVYEVFVSFG